MTTAGHPEVTRLLPAPAGPTTIREAYDVERPRPDDRPWIGLCMVASLDGSVTVDGLSGGLGNPNDLDVLLTLREYADAVIVGAGTVRGEGYGPPRHEGKRIGVVTNSGTVDATTELFRSGAGFVITSETAEVPDGVECLRAGHDRVDLAAAMARLAEIVPDVQYVQAEGGPTLNAAFADADLVDEIDLTVSPMMVGGDGMRLTSGADEHVRRFELAHLLADTDGFVFGRWLRRRSVGSTSGSSPGA
jgi:riboflavin biosynthesis pyrimidine reductase